MLLPQRKVDKGDGRFGYAESRDEPTNCGYQGKFFERKESVNVEKP